MTDPAGRFVWYELTTTDAEAATKFYADVVGWTAEVMPMGEFDYTLLKAGDKQVAGLFVMPPSMPGAKAPPMWTGYIAVDDVDAAAGKVKQLGGSIFKAPDDIPGVGRFAVAGDPAGAAFCLFKGLPPEGGYQPPPTDQPGYCAWHELYAGDLDRDWAFYEAMFGWTKDRAMETPGDGVYQMFANHGEVLGGMMTKTADQPRPLWNFYFMVPDIDAAIARVADGGGKVIMGPMQVPSGAWVMSGVDPQGAVFALVGPRH